MLNPNEIGPLQLILVEYQNDPDYFEKKSKELIIEAQYAMKDTNPLTIEEYGMPMYKEKIQKAIFFLAIARCIRELKNPLKEK